jgi:hypothetical protein
MRLARAGALREDDPLIAFEGRLPESNVVADEHFRGNQHGQHWRSKQRNLKRALHRRQP